MRLRSLAPLIGTAALLAACGQQELYGDLSERDVNEMLAVVQSAGLEASKSTDGETWALKTSSADFPRAVAVLHDQGYPREQFADMGEVFEKEGFVSSPLEQHMRMRHALQQELAQTLSSIDGVVQARVHIAVPENDPLAEDQAPSSASVFIKHQPDVDMSAQTAQIKALVVNSIEGLPYEKVTVVAFPASQIQVAPAAPSYVAMGTPIGAIIIGIGGLAIYGLYRRPRGAAKLAKTKKAV